MAGGAGDTTRGTAIFEYKGDYRLGKRGGGGRMTRGGGSSAMALDSMISTLTRTLAAPRTLTLPLSLAALSGRRHRSHLQTADVDVQFGFRRDRRLDCTIA